MGAFLSGRERERLKRLVEEAQMKMRGFIIQRPAEGKSANMKLKQDAAFEKRKPGE